MRGGGGGGVLVDGDSHKLSLFVSVSLLGIESRPMNSLLPWVSQYKHLNPW